MIKAEGEFQSLNHVYQYLISREMVPIAVKKKTFVRTKMGELWPFQPKIKTQDMMFLCKQLGVMLGAGISIATALELLAGQTLNLSLRKKIYLLLQEVQKGSLVSDAMTKHGGFPKLLTNMMHSGELSGNMDKVMKNMAAHYDQQVKLRQTLSQALTYPLLVLATAIGVIPVLMIFVVPGFIDIFRDTGIALPQATQIMISFSQWIKEKWQLMIVVLLMLVLGLMIFKKSKKGTLFFDSLIFKIPIVGEIYKKMITGLFAQTLSLLVTSGIPLFQSLEIVGQVLGNTVAKAEIRVILEKIRAGSTISQALKISKIYPPMLISMIHIGEESGALDDMLGEIADFYNLQVDAEIKQAALFIEPLLISVIAFVVGGMMMAVMLPTFTLATEFM